MPALTQQVNQTRNRPFQINHEESDDDDRCEVSVVVSEANYKVEGRRPDRHPPKIFITGTQNTIQNTLQGEE